MWGSAAGPADAKAMTQIAHQYNLAASCLPVPRPRRRSEARNTRSKTVATTNQPAKEMARCISSINATITLPPPEKSDDERKQETQEQTQAEGEVDPKILSPQHNVTREMTCTASIGDGHDQDEDE